MQPKTTGTELFGIEILRFLAALAILVWHYQHFFFTATYDGEIAPSLRPGYPFYRALEFFYDYGLYAVQVFWIISGFVFMRRYYEVVSAGRMTFETFAIRRFSRLYPLHVVTLVAVALLQGRYLALHGTGFIYQDNGLSEFAAQALLASNWFSGQPISFNGPIWSVSVEMLIYGLFYAVVRPWNLAGLQSPVYRLSMCAFPLMILTTAVPVLSTYVLMCGMFFLCGALTERMWTHARALPAAAGVLVLLAIGYLFGVAKPNTGFVLLFGVAATIVSAHLDRFVPERWLRLAAMLGNATYSSYLLHFPVQLAAVVVVDGLGLPREVFLNPLIFLAYAGGVIGAGLLTYRLFEMPVQGWLRAVLPGRFKLLKPASVQ